MTEMVHFIYISSQYKKTQKIKQLKAMQRGSIDDLIMRGGSGEENGLPASYTVQTR
jgi:hypothetical protein